MIATSDGGFLVSGDAVNGLTAGSDIELIKFNSSGGIEWVGLYGGEGRD